MQDAKAAHPGDPKAQLVYLIDRIKIPAATGQGSRKGRPVSDKTRTAYFDGMVLLIETLAHLNAKPTSLDTISLKNVKAALQHWEQKKLAASTMATRYTCIKRMLNLIGKETEFPSIRELMVDPANARRTYSATDPTKSWNQTDIDETIALVTHECQFSGMVLKLAKEFGLRAQEALMLRPQLDSHKEVLGVVRGAKGGRGRLIPIENDTQRELLTLAKTMVNPKTGCLGPFTTLEGNRNRFYYVLKTCGITRTVLNATTHGLRHHYMNTTYEHLTGHLSPVNGGPQLTKLEDKKVREELSLRAGHSRTDVVSAYIGTCRHISKATKECLDQLITQLEGCQPLTQWIENQRNNLDKLGFNLTIHLAGDTLKRRTNKPGQVIISAFQITPKDPGDTAEPDDTLVATLQVQFAKLAATHLKLTFAFCQFESITNDDVLEILKN
jgi:integrase